MFTDHLASFIWGNPGTESGWHYTAALLLVAAALSLAMGLFVVRFGQDQRVKFWFFLTCLSSAALAVGLWIELNFEQWAFFAARVNMTAALITAGTGLISSRIICGFRTHRRAIMLLAVSALLIIVTVWLTDLYFTGKYFRYVWGLYVGAEKKFIINPALVAVIAVYCLYALARNYRQAHPLDKNRTKYIVAAYGFLSLSLIDYLPHFGIDWFGGPVSSLSIPLFVGTFGYASLRYRLVEFQSFLGRSAGYILTALLMAGGYVLFLDASNRWLHLSESTAHVGAGLFMAAILVGFGRLLPDWLQQWIAGVPTDFQGVLQQFSDEIMTDLDEAVLRRKLQFVCVEVFDSSRANYMDAAELKPDAIQALQPWKVVDVEVFRRKHKFVPGQFSGSELIVPMVHQDALLGALSVGKKNDGRMYGDRAIGAFSMLGNIFTMAVSYSRSARELEKRHHLDRYLAPQIVENILTGNHTLLETRKRMVVTIFFSDLKGFTEMADRLPADRLSAVLNEYLSDMADTAFSFGGTVDKFIGDAVMVFFGAPVESQAASQAEQCVRMAIAMQERTRILSERWRKQGLLDAGLTSRMGIHTGEATVGAFGSHSRVEYTAIGKAVNLASRLEGKCTPGRILLSRDTWSLVADKFRSEPRGGVHVKGFTELVEVFEIDPLASGASSIDRTSRSVAFPEGQGPDNSHLKT